MTYKVKRMIEMGQGAISIPQGTHEKLQPQNK